MYTLKTKEPYWWFLSANNSVIANFNIYVSVTLNNLHSTYCSSSTILSYLISVEAICQIAWIIVIRLIYRLPNRTHTIKIKVDIETRLDRSLAKFIFTIINHNNDVVKSITRFIWFSPSSILAETISYIHISFLISTFKQILVIFWLKSNYQLQMIR